MSVKIAYRAPNTVVVYSRMHRFLWDFFLVEKKIRREDIIIQTLCKPLVSMGSNGMAVLGVVS